MISIEEMKDDIEQFYESAGFDHFYEKVLKDATDDQVRQMHEDAYKEGRKND